MKGIVRRFFGFITLLVGLALTGWIIYNLINPQPEFTRSTGGSMSRAVKGLFLGVFIAGTGGFWLFGKSSNSGSSGKNGFPSDGNRP